MKSPSPKQIAWIALTINILTILGGTLVRATGSGAGCGESWPSCHGQLVPGFSSIHTQIEFAHRATSGLSLLAVLWLFIAIYRNYEKSSIQRKAVNLSAIAIIVESLLGAWLVLARLVEDNASVMRAISVPIHLVNTLFLLAAITATLWSLTHGTSLKPPQAYRKQFWGAIVGFILIGATGAIAALADTLFPVESIAAGIAEDFSNTAHFLSRLRVLHPIVAIAMSMLIFHMAGGGMHKAPKPAKFVIVLLALQLAVGLLNVLLLTPVAIQIAHLLIANLLWVGLLWLGGRLHQAEID